MVIWPQHSDNQNTNMAKDIDFFSQNKLELLGMTLIEKNSLSQIMYSTTT